MDDSHRLKLPAKLAFDVSNAGPGYLECILGGRKMAADKSGSRIRFDLTGDGLNGGEHDFQVKFGNYLLSDAPRYVKFTIVFYFLSFNYKNTFF